VRIANQDKRAREFYTFLIALTLGLLVSVPTQIVVAPSAVAAQDSECVIGSSALCPATSPQEIYNLYGTTTDRTYFIKVNGVATEVFVLMNRTGSDNGGWILLMKGTQGTSNFAYTSTMFTSNTSTLNPSSLTNDVATDAKFSAYNNLSIVKMLGVLRNPATGTITANGDIASNAFGGHVWFETFGASTAYTKLTTTTSLNSPANDNFTSVPERKWKTTVSGSQVLSYQPGFGRYGFNGSPCSNTDFQYRWGIAWNQEADWSSCDVVVGIGLVSRSPGDHVIWSGVTTGSVTSNTGHGNTGFQIWGKVAEPSLGAPTSVTATASGSGQINLSWGAPTATSPVDYVVQYKTAAAGSYSNSFIVSGQTTATINGLTNGASYNFRVFARTAGDSTSAANIANSTIIKSVSSQLSTPTAPTVSATSNTLKSIDVSWSAISNASSYTVKVYNDSSTLLSTSGLTGLTGTSTTITTTNLASLADATPYKVSITAIGNGSSFLDSSESLKSDVTTTGAALTPTFGTPTATADGFTVQISNYSASYTWAGTATASGSVAISGTGLVTVTGVAPGTQSVATITTTRTGYTSGSATATGTSITGSALTPTFGTPTATADGFTVQISNYSASYTWAGTATASGSVAINGTGLVTVTGVAPGTASTATITTTRTGYTSGSATATGTSITGSALTPTFGSPTATADGFTVQISNYSASYTWAGTATASGSVAINGTGLVTVTGVAPGTASTATITTTRTGYTSGSATATGTSITGSALTPTFGSPTATADGFTVQISNYSASYTWAGSATASASVAISGTGLVTVTGVAPGTQSVATITTTRTGYTSGSATVTGTSITGSALSPTFGSATATNSGFTVQISNYSASYTWAGTATASGSVSINGTGLVTVTGVGPGKVSVATITTTRTGYTSGSATVSATANRVLATSTVVTPGTDAALVLVRTTFLQTNPIAARVNTPSKVTFLANNKAIPGCSALKTVLVSSNHTATCNYRPTSLGSLTLSATITPNDTGYIAVTRSVKVVVSPK
jgi:hypothetical protein